MKLLFLTPQLPYPPQQGTSIRNFNIIRQLAPRHDITLLSFATSAELDRADPLRTLCSRIEIASYPARSTFARAWTTVASSLPDMALRLQSATMHAKFDALLQTQSFDVIQVEGIEMARYVLNSRWPAGKCHLVFDDHNAEYLLQRTAFESDLLRPARWHAALYSWIQWHKLAAYEQEICRRADTVVACSDADANAIRQLLRPKSASRNPQSQPDAPSSGIAVVPNGVDTSYYCPTDDGYSGRGTGSSLVFTGKMDFRPNIDAVTWLCTDILPRVRAELPLTEVVIVGQKPTPRISALGHQPGVRITGWVPDTRP